VRDADPFIPLPALPARLGIKSIRTVYRWINGGFLPKPTKINGRNYFRTSVLEKAERKLDGADVESAAS
jgi:predicted DNA-binding transcriptional regulator AlpA